MKFKHSLPLAGAICSLVTASLFAYDDDMMDNRYQQDKQQQQQDLPRSAQYDNGKYREITPNAGPRVAHGADVFITADFIYWTVREDGLGFVMSGFGNGTTNAAKGSIHHPDWEFDPGFKVGLGLNLDHDGWDIYAQYTWLYSDHASRKAKNKDFGVSNYFPTWDIGADFSVTPPSFGQITRAKTDWSNHFNVIDLELGRNYFISQYLTLRPHVGFKGTWQDQDYKVTYRRQESASVNNDLRMRQCQDYWGVGIRTGLDTAWHFTTSFSIYGDFAISALWSQFQVDRKDTQKDVTSNTPAFTAIHTQNDFHSIKGVVEFGIGLRWETWWSDDDYHFAIQAGWEEQVWINHNQFIHIQEESSHGDMIMQGLTVEIRFDF